MKDFSISLLPLARWLFRVKLCGLIYKTSGSQAAIIILVKSALFKFDWLSASTLSVVSSLKPS